MVDDVPIDSEASVGFVNLENLPAQSPKILTGVGFTYVYIHRGVSVRAL